MIHRLAIALSFEYHEQHEVGRRSRGDDSRRSIDDLKLESIIESESSRNGRPPPDSVTNGLRVLKKKKSRNFPSHLVRRSLSTYAIVVYFFWVWIGIAFYMLKNNWDLGTAYYYSVEAGLSVGYC